MNHLGENTTQINQALIQNNQRISKSIPRNSGWDSILSNNSKLFGNSVIKFKMLHRKNETNPDLFNIARNLLNKDRNRNKNKINGFDISNRNFSYTSRHQENEELLGNKTLRPSKSNSHQFQEYSIEITKTEKSNGKPYLDDLSKSIKKKISSSNPFFMQLQKEIPNLNKPSPASRMEAKILNTFMQKRLRTIDLEIEEENKFDQKKELFDVCLNELKRQIKSECSERVIILDKIWSWIQECLIEKEKSLESKNVSIIGEAKKAMTKIVAQKEYELQIKIRESSDLELQINTQQKLIHDLAEENSSLKIREDVKDEVISKFKIIKERLEQKLKELKSYNTLLKEELDIKRNRDYDDEEADEESIDKIELNDGESLKIDELNKVIISGVAEKEGKPIPVNKEVQAIIETPVQNAEIQTNIILFDDAYDLIFESQKTINKALKLSKIQEEVKNEFGSISSNEGEILVQLRTAFTHQASIMINLENELAFSKSKTLEIMNVVESQDKLISNYQSELGNLKSEMETLRSSLKYRRTSLQKLPKALEVLQSSLSIKNGVSFVAEENKFKVTEESDIITASKLRRSVTEKKTRIQKKKLAVPRFFVKMHIDHYQINEGAQQLVEKVKNNKITKFNNFMPPKLIFKQISVIYESRIHSCKDGKTAKEQDLASFTYNLFLSNYGFKKITDQKFLIFMLSLKKEIYNRRINTFAKFIGLISGESEEHIDELNKYVDSLDYVLNQSKLGTPVPNSDSDLKFYVPFIRVFQYIGQTCPGLLSTDDLSNLKAEVDLMKENDPSKLNKNGIIDFDSFILTYLNFYQKIINNANNYLKVAFNACDLNGNGLCDLDEFLLLMKHIESQRFEERRFTVIFNEKNDVSDGIGENYLSFKKFVVVCVELKLLSQEQQMKFLDANTETEVSQKCEELLKNWPDVYDDMMQELSSINLISDDEKYKWEVMINELDSKIQENNSIDTSIAISAKIILNEIKKLKEQEEQCKNEGNLLDDDELRIEEEN